MSGLNAVSFFSIFSPVNISNVHEQTTKQFVDANSSPFPNAFRTHYWSCFVDVHSWPDMGWWLFADLLKAGRLNLICCSLQIRKPAKYHFTLLLLLLWWVLHSSLFEDVDIQTYLIFSIATLIRPQAYYGNFRIVVINVCLYILHNIIFLTSI